MRSVFAKRMVGSSVRHFATAVAGALITYGYVDQEAGNQLAGAIVALGTVGWSAWEKAAR